MRYAWALVVLALALGGGCDHHSTVMEEDRQGLDVHRQIIVAQDAELDRIETALKESPDLKTSSIMPIVERMREKNEDARQINDQLLSNFNGPKQSTAYSHAEVESILKRMKKAHTVSFWAGLGAGALSVGLVIIGLARSPLARLIPGVGTILGSLDSVMGAAETWMKKMKDSGQPQVAEGLASVLQAGVSSPAVEAFIEKKLANIKAGVTTVPEKVEVAASIAADAAAEVQVVATA